MRNSVMLIGRPTTDPTINEKFGIAAFTLLVTEQVMNKQTHEWEQDSFSIRCSCDNEKLTKRIADNIRKGYRVAIDGKIQPIDGSFYISIHDLFIIDKPNE